MMAWNMLFKNIYWHLRTTSFTLLKTVQMGSKLGVHRKPSHKCSDMTWEFVWNFAYRIVHGIREDNMKECKSATRERAWIFTKKQQQHYFTIKGTLFLLGKGSAPWNRLVPLRFLSESLAALIDVVPLVCSKLQQLKKVIPIQKLKKKYLQFINFLFGQNNVISKSLFFISSKMFYFIVISTNSFSRVGGLNILRIA